MLVVGIAGGTGAGKTTVVNKITERLPMEKVAVIPQDNYYKDNSHLPIEERKKLNFDHPSAIEFELLIQHVQRLKNNQPVQMPTYSYLTCTRNEECVEISPKDVVIVEGILIMTSIELCNLLDIKVFVDADPDDRLMRCLQRDILQRHRTVEEVLERYMQSVKPMHNQFIEPSKRFADLIVPQGGENQVAINVLASMILLNLR